MSNLFSGVRGQKRAVRILSSQLLGDGLSHAYLFTGKEGSGKEYLAKKGCGYSGKYSAGA